MSIITFWNGTKDQVGTTSSAIAFAVQSALKHNIKIILISTSFNDETIREGFWKENTKKSLFSGNGGNGQIDTSGVEGLEILMRSGKIAPNRITEYTKVLLKDRLEVMLGMEYSNVDQGKKLYEETQKKYPQIIALANQYYDLVIVDLDKNLKSEVKNEILRNSTIIVPMVLQKAKQIQMIQNLINQNDILKAENTVLTIGKYMEDTKYNAKNITRVLLRKKELINAIPYNNIFFEALQEGRVIDIFFDFMKIKEKDINYRFVQELDRLFDIAKEKEDILKMRRM